MALGLLSGDGRACTAAPADRQCTPPPPTPPLRRAVPVVTPAAKPPRRASAPVFATGAAEGLLRGLPAMSATTHHPSQHGALYRTSSDPLEFDAAVLAEADAEVIARLDNATHAQGEGLDGQWCALSDDDRSLEHSLDELDTLLRDIEPRDPGDPRAGLSPPSHDKGPRAAAAARCVQSDGPRGALPGPFHDGDDLRRRGLQSAASLPASLPAAPPAGAPGQAPGAVVVARHGRHLEGARSLPTGTTISDVAVPSTAVPTTAQTSSATAARGLEIPVAIRNSRAVMLGVPLARRHTVPPPTTPDSLNNSRSLCHQHAVDSYLAKAALARHGASNASHAGSAAVRSVVLHRGILPSRQVCRPAQLDVGNSARSMATVPAAASPTLLALPARPLAAPRRTVDARQHAAAPTVVSRAPPASANESSQHPVARQSQAQAPGPPSLPPPQQPRPSSERKLLRHIDVRAVVPQFAGSLTQVAASVPPPPTITMAKVEVVYHASPCALQASALAAAPASVCRDASASRACERVPAQQLRSRPVAQRVANAQPNDIITATSQPPPVPASAGQAGARRFDRKREAELPPGAAFARKRSTPPSSSAAQPLLGPVPVLEGAPIYLESGSATPTPPPQDQAAEPAWAAQLREMRGRGGALNRTCSSGEVLSSPDDPEAAMEQGVRGALGQLSQWS